MTLKEARAELILSGVDEHTVTLFIAWLKNHLDVWKQFETKSLRLIASGVEHYGAKAIFEVIRYENVVEKKIDFKCNNNYAAYLARLFVIKFPAHRDFFEFRDVKGLRRAA